MEGEASALNDEEEGAYINEPRRTLPTDGGKTAPLEKRGEIGGFR